MVLVLPKCGKISNAQAAGSAVTAILKKAVPTVKKSCNNYHEKAVTTIMKKLSQMSGKAMMAIMRQLSQLS